MALNAEISQLAQKNQQTPRGELKIALIASYTCLRAIRVLNSRWYVVLSDFNASIYYIFHPVLILDASHKDKK